MGHPKSVMIIQLENNNGNKDFPSFFIPHNGQPNKSLICAMKIRITKLIKVRQSAFDLYCRKLIQWNSLFQKIHQENYFIFRDMIFASFSFKFKKLDIYQQIFLFSISSLQIFNQIIYKSNSQFYFPKLFYYINTYKKKGCFIEQNHILIKMKAQSIIKNPSIHNIIIEDQNLKLTNQIQQYFKPQSYSTFPINDLKSMPNYDKDERFYILVKQLEVWNNKVQSCSEIKLTKAQFFRNQFVYTSLRSIIVNGSKGSKNYQGNLNKLYQWFRKNTQQQTSMYLTSRKRNLLDEDWQVRKTFKSNMPLELKNYQRRALFTTGQDVRYLQNIHNKKFEFTNQKLVDYSAIKEEKRKQLKYRQFREQQEIKHSKTLLKSKKSRFQQDHCRHFQYYKGKFNQLSKTSTFFGRFTDNKALNSTGYPTIRNKNIASFSIFNKEKKQFQNIQKYRLNTALAKKGNIRQHLQQKDLNTANMNKRSKSFMTRKADTSVYNDLYQVSQMNETGTNFNFIKTQKNKQFTPQSSVIDKQNIDNDNKNNAQDQDEIEFNILKNWQGQRLISNPFDKKKATLTKKKK